MLHEFFWNKWNTKALFLILVTAKYFYMNNNIIGSREMRSRRCEAGKSKYVIHLDFKDFKDSKLHLSQTQVIGGENKD